ncbi:hypothetical protein Tco_0956642 [Tanacetum coccineum]
MSEALKYGIEHGKADRDLAAVEAYDPEADSKYVKALQDLKDLKYPLVDQLEGLKDALMELIVASLHLGVVPEKMPPNPWAFKEEMMLEDAIAANISRAVKRRSAGWFVANPWDWFKLSADPTASPYSCLLSLPRGWRLCWRMPPHRPSDLYALWESLPM